ncbi:MAG: polysaccharide biosynthesis tyrosine autokinase [Verrucomicrobiota bacterium JB022]|nr:polysaccharide biosynthesis tyrosine autokinase [Verrucomicrobiota bacterium JB022]
MPAARAESQVDPLSLGEVLRILRVHWLVVFTVTALAVFAAAAWTQLFLQPWYYAESTIRVERPDQENEVLRPVGFDTIDRTFINNQFETLQSRTVLLPVIERLGLEQRLSRALDLNGTLDREQTYLYLTRKMLEVRDRPNTSVLDIGVWAPDRQLSADIANEIARVYEQNRITFATATQNQALTKLQEQLALQDDEVRARRDKVEALRQELGLAGYDLNLQDSQPELEALRQLERTLINLRVEALARKTRWQQFARVAPEDRLSVVNNELISDQNIQQLAQAYLIQQQEVEQLRNQLGENHPDLASRVARLRVLREQLDGLLKGYERALEIAYLEAQARVTAMEQELAQARAEQINVAGEKYRLFDDAVKDVREAETVLRSMRLQLRQREIELQVPKRTIELLNLAAPPLKAGRPNWALNLSVAAFLGLILGGAGAMLLELIDSSFRDLDTLEERLGLPVLGVVPREDALVTRDNFESPTAEVYRVIGAHLQLANSGAAQILLVQSAGAGEGKSTVLRNLAACAALAGERVLVIDSDLRRPTQHQLLQTPNQPGLVDYLLGQQPAEALVQATHVPGLDLIPAGSGALHSLTLLHREKLQQLLDGLRGRYAHIFLDSPPVLGVSDASVLQLLADGVLLIVQYGRLPQPTVARAARSVQQRAKAVAGVVFNQVPESQTAAYGYYGYTAERTPEKPSAGESEGGAASRWRE